MNTKDLFSQKDEFINYLRNSGRCENVIKMNKNILKKFEIFLLSNNITIFERKEVRQFLVDTFDYNNKNSKYQSVLRRPIIAFVDFYNNGYIKREYKLNNKEITLNNKLFLKVSNEYYDKYIKNSVLSSRSKKRKQRVIKNFLNDIKHENFSDIKDTDIMNYFKSLYKIYDKKTVNCYKYILKEFLNYLYQEKFISIHIELINIKEKVSNDIIASSFTKEEIKTILNSVDISTKNGKHNYLIMVLLVYYGLRAGDIIRLRLKNIDFEKNTISLVQSKTKKDLILPLIDEVKFALLDYLKNSRPINVDEDCILLTIHPPYKKYLNCDSIKDIITNIIKKSKIDMKDRKYGSRVFRHSLATNMINDNVELYKISNILGHTNTYTTSKYISRDIAHLEMLTLEVPNEE